MHFDLTEPDLMFRSLLMFVNAYYLLLPEQLALSLSLNQMFTYKIEQITLIEFYLHFTSTAFFA